MYTYYMVAWHHVFVGDLDQALAFSKKCEEHTPTFVENALLQAKILKALYKYKEAASVLEEYFKIDKADRYIVNKTTKYKMRAGQVKDADTLFKTFVFRNEEVEKTIHIL